MTLQELAKVLTTKKRCIDCKFSKKIKRFDWRCAFEDERQEIHPLLPACENFQPREDSNEKGSNF